MSRVALKHVSPDTLKPDTLKTKGDFNGFKIAKTKGGIEKLIDLIPAQTVSVYFSMQQYLFPDKES